MNRLSLSASFAATALAMTSMAHAQAPAPYPQQQPPPGYAPAPQGYPQPAPQGYPQQVPPQGYPQQAPQGYPQQYPPQQGAPQGYPQQGYPQQGYPQQYPPQPYPPQQGAPQGYPQQGYPQQYPPQPYPPQGYPQQYPPQGYAPPPSAPVQNDKRSANEMVFLYGTSIGYGVGSGIWIDALAKASDPGVAFIAPLVLGAGAPVGVYLMDNYSAFHRGVPASIATGIVLGTGEGIGISGVQWQATGNGTDSTWSFGTQTTVTWAMATGGAVGGWAFGEWLRPDPRSLAFIASGAGWGAISGGLLGAGVVSGDWKDGASVYGLIGYNAGILATGALSINYVPSWQTQKYMWYGFLGGTAAASIVYVFYLFRDNQPGDVQHGLIANGIGGLAGLALAGALTANLKDPDQSAEWKPPFQLGFSPVPHGGAVLNASGQF